MNQHTIIQSDPHTNTTNLSIDKISMTYFIKDRSMAKQLTYRLDQVSDAPRFKNLHVKPSLRHRFRVSLPIPSGESFLGDQITTIDVVARYSGISDLRVECNPTKIGPFG